MVAIFFGKGAYKRSGFPNLRLVNMYAETTPADDDDGVALVSLKPLGLHSAAGDGPVRGVFRQAGVFDGDLFRVSGTKLYRGADLLGEIQGSGDVAFAARNGELLVCADGPLYSYDGSTFEEVTFPEGYSVIDIDFHDGLYIAATSHADGSHRWYWSGVLDGRSWDELDFASAESKPDKLLGLKVINDTLWLFGSETIEPWANVGDPEAPYERFEQRIFAKGMHSAGAKVEIDNAIVCVGGDNIVYRLGEGMERISDHGIEERIALSETVKCFGFVDDGHSFAVIVLDSEAFAFDAATGQWCELDWTVSCATDAGAEAIFGDSETGKAWTLGGSEERQCIFTAAVPLPGGTLTVDSISIWANVGESSSEPLIEMRSSRNQGKTWTNWRSVSLGALGEYDTRPRWRRCGMFSPPGAMFEFRMNGTARLRIGGVYINEPGSGR